MLVVGKVREAVRSRIISCLNSSQLRIVRVGLGILRETPHPKSITTRVPNPAATWSSPTTATARQETLEPRCTTVMAAASPKRKLISCKDSNSNSKQILCPCLSIWIHEATATIRIIRWTIHRTCFLGFSNNFWNRVQSFAILKWVSCPSSRWLNSSWIQWYSKLTSIGTTYSNNSSSNSRLSRMQGRTIWEGINSWDKWQMHKGCQVLHRWPLQSKFKHLLNKQVTSHESTETQLPTSEATPSNMAISSINSNLSMYSCQVCARSTLYRP